MQNKIPDTNRLIRIKEVMHLTALNKSLIYQFEKEGKFPKRIKLSKRVVAWRYSEVVNWVHNLASVTKNLISQVEESKIKCQLTPPPSNDSIIKKGL